MRRVVAAAVSAAAGFAAILALHRPAVSGGAAPPVSVIGPRHTAPPGSTTSVPSTAPAAQGGTVAAVGAVEQYGYGLISVRVTVKGGRIVEVSVARLLTAESYSQSLAQQVIPMLRNEVLAAQSAQVSTVSGATYTSEAYLSSIQSALDRLHR